MSKNKTSANGVATLEPTASETQPLLRINFDDIDSIPETEPVESEIKSDAPSEDSEEQVLSTVETFDSEFANDPLRDKWRAFGTKIKERVDNTSDAIFFIECGRELHNLMIDYYNLAPNSYKRPAFVKRCDHVLRLLGVPDSMVRPNELLAIYWLMMLDQSTDPTEAGEARSFKHDVVVSEWVGGNLSMGSLRVMVKSIERVSRREELDSWEYKAGFQAWSRDKVNILRTGHLSMRQVDSLYDAKLAALEQAAKRDKYAGKTAAEIASLEAGEKNEVREKKLASIGSAALTLAKAAREEVGKGPSELKTFLADKGIIPPDRFVTAAEYAAQMTPGDAKALVQELVKLYGTGKTDRMQVFKVLYGTCKAVVDQIKSAQEQQKAAKVA